MASSDSAHVLFCILHWSCYSLLLPQKTFVIIKICFLIWLFLLTEWYVVVVWSLSSPLLYHDVEQQTLYRLQVCQISSWSDTDNRDEQKLCILRQRFSQPWCFSLHAALQLVWVYFPWKAVLGVLLSRYFCIRLVSKTRYYRSTDLHSLWRTLVFSVLF